MSASVIEIGLGNGGFAYLAKWAKLRGFAIEIDARCRRKRSAYAMGFRERG